MKGMLIKDLNILCLQKNFLVLTVLISAIMLVTMENPSFLIAYVTMMLGFMVLSTISYDEFDNGNAFLFTLPITKKGYVLEKYCLALLLGSGAWLLSTVASMAVSVGKIEGFNLLEGILGAVIVLAVCIMLMSFMIPVQLKYGGEKSRVVMIAIAGIVVLLVYLLKYLYEKLSGVLSIDGERILHVISSIDVWGLMVISLLAAAAAVVISFSVSVKILKKKEF